ncbi:MAG TPA: xanthine dehydrogenase family protein subunit M [Dehalococcoidia bacterium]|nr:xanthine dehydrogenase family protein subunit M [Dehalococcoidia bacterium]
MRDFQFHAPATLDEALALLAEHGEAARPMAGGTALVVLMKQSLVEAEQIVSLARIPGLDTIRVEGGELHIGGLARHYDVETSPVVRGFAPFLCEVYRRVATVRVRNMATVGGGLAHADPAQDPPPGFIALDARVRLVSRGGQRELPVAELSRDYYETVIRPDEILTEVIVPRPASGAAFAYLKFLPRTEDDYATVAVAARAERQNGVCRNLRVALGAAGPTPIRATAVEQALEGRAVSTASVRAAAETVADAVDPLDDFRGSSGYKREMAVVFTRRALERVLGLTA